MGLYFLATLREKSILNGTPNNISIISLENGEKIISLNFDFIESSSYNAISVRFKVSNSNNYIAIGNIRFTTYSWN